MVKIGIIGGTGFSSSGLLKNITSQKVHTPYGAPSDLVTVGKYQDIDLVILPRHGAAHNIYPTLVNFRANIWALKELGVTHIIAITAVGSLREEIKPGDLVFPDQFIDRTTMRKSTFFEGQQVCHIPMAEPFCENLRALFGSQAKRLALNHHKQGTVITIEGPRFSTRAESRMYRQWGADIINMSTVPEVVLAREAGICYATVAMSTDYDCWHESEEPVTWEIIQKIMNKNIANVTKLLFAVIPEISDNPCPCREVVNSSTL